jgi:uncharacterized membrane protein
MSNPYQTTVLDKKDSDEVKAPAMALMIVATISVVLVSLGLVMDIFLLMSGAMESLDADDRRPIPPTTSIIVRMVWGLFLAATSSFVLFGAIKMKDRSNLGLARASAIVALVPCVGPCCILGIPFGIWALLVLNKPHVKGSFRDSQSFS